MPVGAVIGHLPGELVLAMDLVSAELRVVPHRDLAYARGSHVLTVTRSEAAI